MTLETILIIGAGREQIEAYKLAKQKGYLVVGTDINPKAPAFEFCDHALIASTRDEVATLAIVKEFARKHPINGIMTIANDVPLTVTAVGEALGIPCIPPSAVKLLCNKNYMKAAFKRRNVATPKSFEVCDFNAFTYGLKEPIGYPAILKPSDGRGSRGVLLIEKGQNLKWAFEHAMSFSDNGILILEEFIIGPQLSVEGIFINGRYEAIAYADRNYNNLPITKPYIVENGGCLPSHFEGPILEEIRLLIEIGAFSLGLSWGVVKADIVLGRKNKPMIIELAGRLSGNYLATHHIPAAYGVDLVGAMIDLCMGKEVNNAMLQAKYKKYIGVRYFFPPVGKILNIIGENQVKEHDYTYMYDMYIKVGDIQPVIDCHVARAGVIMCTGDNYDQAVSRVEKLVCLIIFDVEKVSD
jgi:biotin carboxylase